jgi:glycosyltransferase involved in cell wall biosynthesis
MEFYCIKNADLLTTPSKFLESVANNLGKKIVYIPHGVDESLKEVKESNLPELDKSQKRLVKFLYMGDICAYKKVDKLIEAAKGEKCILYIIGKVYDDISLKDLPANVIYLDEMPHEKVLSYLKSCDVGIITGDQDSTLRMFEYLYYGKPILALRGRIDYVLEHKHDVYSVTNFKAGIRALIHNPELRRHLAINAKKFKVNSWSTIGKEYDKIIKSLKKNG